MRFADFTDAIGQVTMCSVEAHVSHDSAPEEEALFGKDAALTVERGDQQRSIRGIIRHARVREVPEHTVVELEIAAAAWMLSQGSDSRIYQDLSVPDLVEQIVQEHLGGRERTVRSELTETYKPHEYLVQHRESHWDFIRRLCDEEGIFLYFDHDHGDHEILVLADSNDNRPLVREDEDGQIHYEENENRTAGREVA